jgi:hypothetical protein
VPPFEQRLGVPGGIRDWVGTVALPPRGASPSHVSVPASRAATCGTTDSLDKTGRRLAWTETRGELFPLASHCGRYGQREDIGRHGRRAGHALLNSWARRCRDFFFCFAVHFLKWKSFPCSCCYSYRPVMFARGRRKKPSISDLQEQTGSRPSQHYSLTRQPSNRSL